MGNFLEPVPGTIGVQEPVISFRGATHIPRRLFVWTGAPPNPTFPANTGDPVHGVTGPDTGGGLATYGFLACKGRPFIVEADVSNGQINPGDNLKTGGGFSGQVMLQGGSGTIVAKALSGASSPNQTIWAVFV